MFMIILLTRVYTDKRRQSDMVCRQHKERERCCSTLRIAAVFREREREENACRLRQQCVCSWRWYWQMYKQASSCH